MTDVWNPEKYLEFKNERTQPFFELLDLIKPGSFESTIDLGCGTGELTKIFSERYEPKKTIGIDNSASMLSKADKYKSPRLDFEVCDLVQFLKRNEKKDLIISNAALQWCDNHTELFQIIYRNLNDGGQIAIQVPANHDYPSHRLAEEIAKESPFREYLTRQKANSVLAPEEYAELIYRTGFKDQKVFLRVFTHLLQNREAVIEWVRGTWLTYYQEKLSADLFKQFMTLYRDRLFSVLPDEKPFFYPFKRIFIWAKK